MRTAVLLFMNWLTFLVETWRINCWAVSPALCTRFHPLAWFGLYQLRQEPRASLRRRGRRFGRMRHRTMSSDWSKSPGDYRRSSGLSLAVEITRGSSLEQRVRSLFDSTHSHSPVGRRTALSLLVTTGLVLSAVSILCPVESQTVAGEIRMTRRQVATPRIKRNPQVQRISQRT